MLVEPASRWHAAAALAAAPVLALAAFAFARWVHAGWWVGTALTILGVLTLALAGGAALVALALYGLRRARRQ